MSKQAGRKKQPLQQAGIYQDQVGDPQHDSGHFTFSENLGPSDASFESLDVGQIRLKNGVGSRGRGAY